MCLVWTASLFFDSTQTPAWLSPVSVKGVHSVWIANTNEWDVAYLYIFCRIDLIRLTVQHIYLTNPNIQKKKHDWLRVEMFS